MLPTQNQLMLCCFMQPFGVGTRVQTTTRTSDILRCILPQAQNTDIASIGRPEGSGDYSLNEEKECTKGVIHTQEIES